MDRVGCVSPARRVDSLLFNRKKESLKKAIFAGALLLGALCAPAFASKMGLLDEEIVPQKEVLLMLEKGETFMLLDARSERSFEAGHIRSAILPRSADYYFEEKRFQEGTVLQRPDADKAVADFMETISREIPIVTYCDDGCQASASLLLKIKKLGFVNVRAMDPGFQTWQNSGFPIEKKV